MKGWYAPKTGDYFTAGTQVKVGTTNYGRKTLSYGNVFYPDWWPENYNFAISGIENVPDTWSVAKTYLYDFNELINLRYADFSNNATVTGSGNSSPTTSGSYDKATWSAKSNNKFGFLSTAIYDSGDIGYFSGVDTTDDRIQTGLAGQITSLFNTPSSPGNGINALGEARYLFQYDEDTGYYYYDSNRNAAAFNQSQKRFYLSENTDKIGGSSGQFLPFNENGVTYSNNKSPINYWFGMKTEISFDLPDAVGDVNANRAENGSPLRFIFSGDDDVLVCVTNNDKNKSALVLDIGGIHGEMYGEINFSDGTWKTGNAGADSKGWPMYTSDDEGSTHGTLQDLGLDEAGSYTLTMYYLERGAGLSNCAIYFNLPNKAPDELPPSGGTNVGSGSVAGKKQIDYLGDGDKNDYQTTEELGDARDLYRLYLTASNDRTANPINVLFVVDDSNSMDESMSGSTRVQAVKDILNGKTSYGYGQSTADDGLLDIILGDGTSSNKVAIVGFGTTAWTIQDWTSSETTAENSVKSGSNRLTGKHGGTNYEDALDEASDLLRQTDKYNPDYPTYMIFISDGVPTYYNAPYSFYPKYENREYYDDGGSGGDNSTNLNKVYPPTMAAIREFAGAHKNLIRYSIGIDDTFTENKSYGNSHANHWYNRRDPLDWLDGTGTCKISTDVDGLKKTLEQALQLTPVSSIYIQDELSQYVDFAGGAQETGLTDVQIWLNTINEEENVKTKIWDNGGPTSDGRIPAGNDPVTGQNYVQKVEIEGKTIKVTFTPGYVLPNNYEFVVSFNVRLTKQAYDEYAAKQGAAYTDAGDKGTDYEKNATSSEQPGFFSNDNSDAKMTYQQDGGDHKVTYPDPVVQVWRPLLTVIKYGPNEDDNGNPEILQGATFTLYELDESNDSLDSGKVYGTEGEGGTSGQITIDNLHKGTYELRETTAPAGYEVSNYALRFEVEHGLIKDMRVVDAKGEEITDGTGGWSTGSLDDVKWSWGQGNPNYPLGQWVFDYTASLTDQKSTIDLQIQKREEGNVNMEVAGAKFSLYQYTGEEPMDKEKAGNVSVDALPGEGYELLHDDLVSQTGQGILTYTKEGSSDQIPSLELEEGWYFLEETDVPAGYNKLDKPVWIHVFLNTEGQYEVAYGGPFITDGHGSSTNAGDNVGSNLVIITVMNSTGYALPETGGVGTAVYTLSGLALTALAGALLCERRRRAARG